MKKLIATLAMLSLFPMAGVSAQEKPEISGRWVTGETQDAFGDPSGIVLTVFRGYLEGRSSQRCVLITTARLVSYCTRGSREPVTLKGTTVMRLISPPYEMAKGLITPSRDTALTLGSGSLVEMSPLRGKALLISLCEVRALEY